MGTGLANAFWTGSYVLLWGIVLSLGFLLLGALRAQALLRWRLEQLEATTPRRLGRDGLKRGKKAPDFTLPSAEGSEVSLHDFAGHKVLLVFAQSGCGPCQQIMPELNKLQAEGEVRVVVINSGELATTRQWAARVQARFPVLVQEKLSISKQFEVYTTPFAFFIDERGVIASKGIINRKQHLRFVLGGTRDEPGSDHAGGESTGSEQEAAAVPDPKPVFAEEVGHV